MGTEKALTEYYNTMSSTNTNEYPSLTWMEIQFGPSKDCGFVKIDGNTIQIKSFNYDGLSTNRTYQHPITETKFYDMLCMAARDRLNGATMLKKLIALGKEHGLDQDHTTKSEILSCSRSAGAVHVLCTAGADVNWKTALGETALMRSHHLPDVAAALLDHGANPHIRSMCGLNGNALDNAIWFGCPHVAYMLMCYGAKQHWIYERGYYYEKENNPNYVYAGWAKNGQRRYRKIAKNEQLNKQRRRLCLDEICPPLLAEFL